MNPIDEMEQQSLTPLKVLIADDDAPTRILLRAAISQWGYDIIEAKDGEEAWEIIQKPDAPRMLILDWLMPKIDGLAICKLSRANLPRPPYIILLTQVSDINNIIRGLDAGADEFLSKPFNMAELRSRLSVGARIMKNENSITAKINQIQLDVAEIEEHVLHAQSIITQMNKKNVPDKKNIQSIESDIERVLTKIKSLQKNI